MFGLIYLTYGALMSGLARINGVARDLMFMQETLDKDTGLYYDSKMRCYDNTLGGRLVHVDYNYNGDPVYHGCGRIVVKDPKTNQVLRDLTQEMMDKEYAELQAHPKPGISVVRWSVRGEEAYDYDSMQTQPRGPRYKDLKTGDIYVVRRIEHDYWKKASQIHPYGSFYMNIEDGMLVRQTDGTYERIETDRRKTCRYTEEEIRNEINEAKEEGRKWIEFFNKMQLEKREKGMQELNPCSYYCNYGM